MAYIGVDLGSTNIKAGLYDSELRCLKIKSLPVEYERASGFVEFDAKKYLADLQELIRDLISGYGEKISCLCFTGQAESLLVLDSRGEPLMNAVSWMDERSAEECVLMEESFPKGEFYARTGQNAALSTWPAGKILWLRKNRPDCFAAAAKYVLLKDYIVYCFTGKLLADRSIATFTFYFDIYKKEYWREMLDFIGIDTDKLPPLAEPCTFAGKITEDAAVSTGLSKDVCVNIGTLDHFAGMVGTGNTEPGRASLSVGTVMGLSVMAAGSAADGRMPMHYGFVPDTYVMLPVAESGGVSLEWFKRTCMQGVSYGDIDRAAIERKTDELLFLPYLVGTNAPEFDIDACGMFFGLRSRHDAFDMARAVMEGTAFLLRRNCEAIALSKTPLERITATGGGAGSAVWCQMFSDIAKVPVDIPADKEAACLGAAMIGAVASGDFSSYKQAAHRAVKTEKSFLPRENEAYEKNYRRFCLLYDAMLAAARLK